MSSFNGMYKHVGQLLNTGKNVVVVYMQLPNDPDHAVVIDTDSLPDSYNEVLRRVVESEDGQNSTSISEILARRMSPDGSQLTLLQKFHEAGKLQRVPVDNIVMTPKRGIQWPLREVLAALQTVKESVEPGFNDLSPEERAIIAAETKKFNMHVHNHNEQDSATTKSQAANLLDMAKLLEADAAQKREQAYRLDPSLAASTRKKINTMQTTESPVETSVETATKTTAKKTASKTVAKKPAAKKTVASK